MSLPVTPNGKDALPACHWACTQQQATFHQLRSNNQANLLIFCSEAGQQTWLLPKSRVKKKEKKNIHQKFRLEQTTL